MHATAAAKANQSKTKCQQPHQAAIECVCVRERVCGERYKQNQQR